MDLASIVGISLAIGGILFGQHLEGGHAGSLMQGAAAFIVICGTFGAVALQTRPAKLREGFLMARLVFFNNRIRRETIITEIANLADFARRNSTLKLEGQIELQAHPFLKRGLRLVVDNMPADKIREILAVEIENYEASKLDAIRIWESAGGYAPTIGILGAVIGLIHVMENLSDPSLLGSGIAVAFVATLYGVALANLVFIPIASKLKYILQEDLMTMEMMLGGLLSISRGDHRAIVQERMNSYIESEL